MTLEVFLRLTQEEQLTVLSVTGIYIGKQTSRPYSLLYQLDSFYVEIVYAKYRLRVSRINCTCCTSILDPYLDQLEIGVMIK